MSRPKYIPSDSDFSRALDGAAKGLNEKEIAKSLGISDSTFKRNKELFRPHLKKGRDKAIDGKYREVESSLLKRALGYEYTEVHKETRIFADGSKQVIVKEVTKQQPSSETASIFFLVNRMPARWQSVNKPHIQENEHVSREDTLAFMNAMSTGTSIEEAKKRYS